jgi:hypothetical protein
LDAELQRPLDPWTGKRVVGDRDEIALASDPGDRGKIDQLEQRIARRFDPDHLRLGPNGRTQPRRLGHVDETHAQIGRALAHVFEQTVRPAIEIVARDDMRAGVERIEHRCHAGEPGGESESARAAFEAGDASLQRRAGRIAAARVIVALVHAGARLHVGRRRIDRRHDRAGRGVGLLPGVNRARGEPLLCRGGGFGG